MQYLDVVLALAAFLGLCVFFNRRCGVAGARTPLLTGCVILLWLTVFGIVGLLRLGGWLLYLTAAALGIWALIPPRRWRFQRLDEADGPTVIMHAVPAAKVPPLFDFGFTAFLIMTLAVTVLFAVRKPVFLEWDEMSFWGTACKLLKLNDGLYTTASVGWDWVGAQQPGAIVTTYFFQFFGQFAPWKCFVAYDVLLFGAYAAVLSAVTGEGDDKHASWVRYPLGVAGALLCVLSPYLLTEYCRILDVTATYMSTYGDIPAGVLAGGAAAWYFAARSGQALPSVFDKNIRPRVFSRELWLVFPVFAGCSLIKENVFPVVLVAAGLAAADTLFCGAPARQGIRERGAVWQRFAFAGMALAVPVAAYLMWNGHIADVVSQRVTEGQVGETNLSTVQVVLLGFRQLLSPAERTPVFISVTQDMCSAFVTTRLTLLGSVCAAVFKRIFGAESFLAVLPGTGAWVVLTVLALFAVAAVLCRDRQQRARTLWAAGLSTLGFVGYYWVLILSYAFIFKPWQTEGLSDYNRYVTPYYLFWFMLALVHLLAAARKDRTKGLLTGVALAAAVLSLAVTAWMIRPQMTALDFPASTFNEQKQFEKNAVRLTELVQTEPRDGKVFFVSTDDNGGKYFTYCYQLLPLQMDYSFGGGPIGSPKDDDGSMYYHAYTCQELQAYLLEKDCDYIFIETMDAAFSSEYATLFTDGLAGVENGVILYARTSDQPLQYAPVGGEA